MKQQTDNNVREFAEVLRKKMYDRGELLQMTPNPDDNGWHCIDTETAIEIAEYYLDKLTRRLREKCEILVGKEKAALHLQVHLMLPFVSEGDKTEYARGVRDTVHNLRLDLQKLANEK